ncbi:winged helix-turn-helix domain-containing protein [Arthrobacter sp. 35W]|uniref:winged helix-turn-helix domain-containing protein n=1 Tax=Arthrobacter sp. 35W TaxID=1132441 RepID=UPI0003FE8778|nr:crosslink repair DNA glycosylase YcaQ family protein [Arthrobacter sp. 35W]
MGAALSLPQARRIALAAQGLSKVRPTGPVDARAVGRTFARLQLVQIDSVNVLARSHYLPFFSRLGGYDRSILERLSARSPRKMMEYWAHEASFIRPEHFADLRLWQNRTWVGASAMEPALKESLAASILDVLDGGPPRTARQLTDAVGHQETGAKDQWGWNWNAVKRVLEDLFEQGVVSAASRSEQFERRYTLTGRVLPPALRAGEDPLDAGLQAPDGAAAREAGRGAAMRRLIEASARAHGIGTVRCLADYFRLPVRAAATAVAELVDQQVLLPVEVRGWDGPHYLHQAAAMPRKAAGRALLSPFDSMVFERRRLERLFGFHYRIEIYTPEPKRRFGYYVLPFLLGEDMVARVDLKADRAAKVLRVRGAYAEPGAPASTAAELAAELAEMALWLDLDAVVVDDRGDLAAALQRESAAMGAGR